MTAQRIVFPPAERQDAFALYARGEVTALDRRRGRIPAGARVSFATYVNAMPVGIWAEYTSMRALSLRMRIDGSLTLTVRGVVRSGRLFTASEDAAATGEVSISVEVPDDAAWVWFEVSAATEAAELYDAEWRIEADEHREVRPSVAITTMNRVDDCRRLIAALGTDGLPGLLHEVVVVDQGGEKVSASGDVRALAPDVAVRLIEQDNLGGSGGFSRGMIEALGAGATHVLVLDDDVMLEPEAIHRMCAFASVARDAPIVGAQMLSLLDPTVLHSMGEVVDRRAMWWHSTEPDLVAADLAEHPLEATPALQRQAPVDYNGWWMCLIPTAVIREIGVSLPLFLKWDDAEYGLRAAQAGHRTVTLPGAAIWHVPWTAKDDGLDWQAYYQLRNRVVTALLHGTSWRGSGLLLRSFAQDVNHVLCGQYGSAALRHHALRDVLAGPDALFATLTTRVGAARDLLARMGQVVVPDADLEPIPDAARAPSRPTGIAGLATRLGRVLLHQLRSVPASAAPRVELERTEGKWWSLGVLDAARVRSATGRGAFVMRRDRRLAARLIADALRLHLRTAGRWRRLGRRYGAAAPRLASPAAWEGVFDSSA
nr:glycosyltransferase [Microbacterium pseudoresistens]